MKTVYVAVLIGMLSGCATTPSGHWEQAGRTELETQDDLAHCEKVPIWILSATKPTSLSRERSSKRIACSGWATRTSIIRSNSDWPTALSEIPAAAENFFQRGHEELLGS